MTSPVIETNIERILEDHLFHEVDLINSRITQLQEEIKALYDRKEKLIRVADAAGISRASESSDSEFSTSDVHGRIP